jgi:hypothetical protein
MIESLDGHLEDENGCFGCNQLAMVAYSASLSGWFNRGIFAPPYHPCNAAQPANTHRAILPSRTCSNLQGACHGQQGTARQSREKEAEEGETQTGRSNLLILARQLWLEGRRWQEGLIATRRACARAVYLPKTASTWGKMRSARMA